MRLPVLLLASVLVSCGGKVDGPGDGVVTADPPPSVPVTPPTRVPTTTYEGYVSINTFGQQLTAFARFPTAPAKPSSPVESGCAIVSPTDEAAEETSAGTITIDLLDGKKKMTLWFSPGAKSYPPAELQEELLDRSKIHVNAAGEANIPAFEGAVEAASAVEIVTPGEGTRIGPVSGDLDVTWTLPKATAAGNGKLTLSLDIRDTRISCQFAEAERHGVIPAALIRGASKNRTGLECIGPWCSGASLLALTGRSTQVIAGSYAITVSHVAGTRRSLELAE